MTGHLVPNILQSSGPSFKGHKDIKTLGTKYSVMQHQNLEDLAAHPHYRENFKIYKIRVLQFKIHMSEVISWCS